jgi:hypothetical protein
MVSVNRKLNVKLPSGLQDCRLADQTRYFWHHLPTVSGSGYFRQQYHWSAPVKKAYVLGFFILAVFCINRPNPKK